MSLMLDEMSIRVKVYVYLLNPAETESPILKHLCIERYESPNLDNECHLTDCGKLFELSKFRLLPHIT